METILLGDLNVGDRIKIKENGVSENYIIVHKGLPSSMYDSSCDGVWVLREYNYYLYQVWNNVSNNYYQNSRVEQYLRNTFYNLFDENMKKVIKTVKIPYVNGTKGSVASGSNGLSCNVFMLSFNEVNGTHSDVQAIPNDGYCLSYFAEDTEDVNNKSTSTVWWLRSPRTIDTDGVWVVMPNGHITYVHSTQQFHMRPALILDSSSSISLDDVIFLNALPTITANKSGDIGTLTDGFDVEYSVNDKDGDTVTVTETLDDKLIRSYAATLNKQETYSLRGNDWTSLANGSHTFKISATDGKDTVEHTITFKRNNRAPVITMSRSGNIGTLADGVNLTYSVTDADNDAVTVTETFDDKQGRQYAAVLGQQESFGITGNEWLQMTNSSHTFKVSAFDGQQTAEKTVTFTRNQTSLSVTLEKPFTADDNIVACQLKVDGDIPDDAVCVYEVTNNALDDVPVWENCTLKSKAEVPYFFENKTATNGFAFNFRVSIKRGASKKGGYITQISGGYE